MQFDKYNLGYGLLTPASLSNTITNSFHHFIFLLEKFSHKNYFYIIPLINTARIPPMATTTNPFSMYANINATTVPAIAVAVFPVE